MRIAVIGGGASGMVAAYRLDQQGHHVTVWERQPMLGGHIRTLNKNVDPNQADCNEILENGVLEFPTKFHNFITLMQELGVELEPVRLGSALFLRDGRYFLSGLMIQKNFQGLHRLAKHIRLNAFYLHGMDLWMKLRFTKEQDFYDQPLSKYLPQSSPRNNWLKLLTMYSYSMPFEAIADFPAALAIPILRDYVFVDWVRIKGGVYSYIEKILERFNGEIKLNVDIAQINRSESGVTIKDIQGQSYAYDKVIFATPPDQVLALLADPTPAEARRFSGWKANHIHTLLHTDTSMYTRYGIRYLAEFDFFQTEHSWGYNAYLNQLCAIQSSQPFNLAFQLEEYIASDRIIHIQQHHTPLYTVEAFHNRDEILATNGENHTYHAGAYLGDGLHEGAVTSGLQVAELIRQGHISAHRLKALTKTASGLS